MFDNKSDSKSHRSRLIIRNRIAKAQQLPQTPSPISELLTLNEYYCSNEHNFNGRVATVSPRSVSLLPAGRGGMGAAGTMAIGPRCPTSLGAVRAAATSARWIMGGPGQVHLSPPHPPPKKICGLHESNEPLNRQSLWALRFRTLSEETRVPPVLMANTLLHPGPWVLEGGLLQQGGTLSKQPAEFKGNSYANQQFPHN